MKDLPPLTGRVRLPEPQPGPAGGAAAGAAEEEESSVKLVRQMPARTERIEGMFDGMEIDLCWRRKKEESRKKSR